MKKIKLFTHNDLDGVGCAVIANLTYNTNVIDVEYCGYDNVNKKISDFLGSKEVQNYKKVFITDISVNGEVAEIIDYFNMSNQTQSYIEFKLFDHHKTALHLNEFVWANVCVENINGKLESGTSLFFNYLESYSLVKINILTKEFVNLVTSYDTWEWTKTGNQKAKDLRDILKIIGKNDFVEYWSKYLWVSTDEEIKLKEHKTLLKYFRQKNNEIIDKKMEKVKYQVDQDGNKFAYVLCDNPDIKSVLGNKMCEELEIDFAAIIYDGGVALRSIGNFDVSEIAKKNGGGGHKNAAAFKLDVIACLKLDC